MSGLAHVELGEVSTIERSSIQPESITAGTQYLGLEHIESGGRILGAQTVTNGERASSKFRFSGKHLLYGKLRPYLAKIALPEFEGVCSTDILPVLPGPKLDRRYLCYVLRQQSMVDLANARSAGANLPRISPSELEKLPIPLPPLAEQKRIAEILDAADALRAKRREALAQLDSFLQATFLDLFGDPVTNPKRWGKVPFSDVVYFQEGPGVRNWQFRDAGIKLINVRNIVDSELDLSNTERHLDPQEVKDKYSHFLLDEGDLVMSSSGVTWGKIAYVRREHLPLCLNTSMIRLRPARPTVVHSFVEAFVQSESFRRQMLRLITGSAQPNFGPSHLRQLEIGLPPLDRQRKFEGTVALVQSQRATQRAHLAELDTLFASLQSHAFRGEL